MEGGILIELAKANVRPSLLRFAIEMEKQLKRNDHKGGWSDMEDQVLLRYLSQKVQEVEDIVQYESSSFLTEKDIKIIIKKCADIGNYAMMIADNHGE